MRSGIVRLNILTQCNFASLLQQSWPFILCTHLLLEVCVGWALEGDPFEMTACIDCCESCRRSACNHSREVQDSLLSKQILDSTYHEIETEGHHKGLHISLRGYPSGLFFASSSHALYALCKVRFLRSEPSLKNSPTFPARPADGT